MCYIAPNLNAMKIYLKYWRWLRVVPNFLLAFIYFYIDEGGVDIPFIALGAALYSILFIAVSGMFRTALLYYLGHKELVWKGQDGSWVKFKMAIYFLIALPLLNGPIMGLLHGDLSLGRDTQLYFAITICLALIGGLNAYAIWANAKEKP